MHFLPPLAERGEAERLEGTPLPSASSFRYILANWETTSHPLLLLHLLLLSWKPCSGTLSTRKINSEVPRDGKYLLSSLRCCCEGLALNRVVLPASGASGDQGSRYCRYWVAAIWPAACFEARWSRPPE